MVGMVFSWQRQLLRNPALQAFHRVFVTVRQQGWQAGARQSPLSDWDFSNRFGEPI
jgi:hypothetical protein